MRKIAIVHYLPLEYYPPITNLLRRLEEKDLNLLQIDVISTINDKGRKKFKSEKITIHRFTRLRISNTLVVRLLKYVYFNLMAFKKLIVARPNTILYFETYSAMPVYLYLRFINKNVNLYIHNHEYFDKTWYDQGMRILRYYHRKEKEFLYHKAKWISQTNSKRIEMFAKDHPLLSTSKLHTLPNYPSERWVSPKAGSISTPAKLIYVGSLSIHTCFLKEICEFIEKRPEKFLLDIYSYNLDEDTVRYLKGLEESNINFFHKGVEYDQLPVLLSEYDVGLILYKPISLNFKYNAPNKLFEYLACGLDVWYDRNLKGIVEYNEINTFPKVVPLDFTDLEGVDFEMLISRKGLEQNIRKFNFETVYDSFIYTLLGV